jgi:RNA polymerase sigma-70 factor (ECF subfamily)
MSGGAPSAWTLRSSIEPLLTTLWHKTSGERYGLLLQEFANMLSAIAEKYLPADSTETEVRELYLSLHVEELVLARSCAAGNETAWDDFFMGYRERIYYAALAITKEESKAQELANSIYAELYGTDNRAGQRKSKLMYYNGRGSLEGWLRTVLAQQHVNRYRNEGTRTTSLEEETESGKQFSAGDAMPVVEVDPRLNSATDQALAAIHSEDRCILAYYFLDGLTLAKIASILGVHESTVSRKLEKLVKKVRKDILSRLTQLGMSPRQAEEALEVDVRDLSVNIRHVLQDSAGEAFSKEKALGARGGTNLNA